MRVGVVNNQVPFLTGGAERHAANLVRALREHGHEAVEVSIPFKWYPTETLARQIMAARMIDLGESDGTPMDLMIGLRFPAWLARHPNKAFWIIHQHRQAYDLWDSGASELRGDPQGMAMRDMIREEDRAALGAKGARVYCNSGNVAARLDRYLGIKAPPLYHPPGLADRLTPGDCGDYLFMPSRIGPMKRQKLAIEALAECRTPVRLRIAGAPDSAAYLEELKSLATRLQVADRIEWIGAISDAEMIRHYAECRGVVFIPIDEDYGYISLEAMIAAKPVITATDSGGPLEFISNEEHGLVVAPEAGALAAAFDRLSDDRDAAIRWGEAGARRYADADMSWERVVRVLTGEQALAGAPVPPTAAPEAPAYVGSAAPPAPEPQSDPGDPVAMMQSAVAPRLPKQPLSYPDIDALYAAYDFERFAPAEEAAPYFGSHWRRYVNTLAAIEASGVHGAQQVLEIGLFPPFIFQAMLMDALPDSRIDGVWEGPDPYTGQANGRNGAPSFSIALRPANAETDPLPCDDGRYDLALGLEILEHLAINPLFFLQQIWRVLKPGGRVVITTPNVVSHRGVGKALRGDAPYSFGVFVPTGGGVYGRHNREYAPREVERLAEAAGFDCVSLTTADVYEDHVDPEIATLLVTRGDDLALRGENIVYVGVKADPRPPAVPDGLYHGNPNLLGGRLELAPREPVTGIAQLSVENRSRLPWFREGEGAVTVFARWRDGRGQIGGAADHAAVRLKLPQTLAPGKTTHMPLRLDTGQALDRVGTLELELFEEGGGLFSLAGRGNRITVPCSEAAYVALMESAA